MKLSEIHTAISTFDGTFCELRTLLALMASGEHGLTAPEGARAARVSPNHFTRLAGIFAARGIATVRRLRSGGGRQPHRYHATPKAFARLGIDDAPKSGRVEALEP